MFLCRLVLVSVTLNISWGTDQWTFPPGFKFGAATSSYQIEGSWNASDKAESIWDRYTHSNPDAIRDRSNGDIACDSYHLYETDVQIAADLGIHYYRFSVSWPRLLPKGHSSYISDDGKRYYNDLINSLLAKGIEPVVTLYHWDLPQSLQDMGGWANPLITDWFADYARVVFDLFGDRVKTFFTINEPLVVCDMSYNLGIFAPGIKSPEATYLCNKHVLLAHAKAYRIYDEEFRTKYHGQLSIVNQIPWFEPDTEDDAEIADLTVQYYAGRYSHPIFSKEGGWPPAIEKKVGEYSKKLGHAMSILPAFTQEEIELVRGTFDFYAVNYYTSFTVRNAKENEQFGHQAFNFIPALNAVTGVRPEWPATVWPIIKVHPEGIRRVLVWLKEHYGDMEYFVTENGCPTHGGLEDAERIEYFKTHLRQLLLAIKEDYINLTHYTAWSLIDNFEWVHGYLFKFGLYEVDFANPQRSRSPRASFQFYANVIKTNALEKPLKLDEGTAREEL